jgi:FkbM family methyltransferase
VLRLIKDLRAQIYNWYIAGPVTWFIMRCPPRRFLSKTFLAKRVLTLKLRTGPSIQCRVNEFVAFVEVFVLRDYDVPGLDWQSVKTIVDVGANIGVATIWFAQRAEQAKFFAVEPAPEALSLLQLNLVAAGLRDRVDIFPVALGRVSGTGQLQESDSSVRTEVKFPKSPVGIGHPIAVITLDQLVRQGKVQSIDLLKLDCEGAEFAILSSAGRRVFDVIGTIVGEYHEFGNNSAKDLKVHLERQGFDVHLRPHPRESKLGMFVARRRRQ